MPACRICQHNFKSLKFQTDHIDICTRCVNTLNESPEPAKNAEARFSEKLMRGMLRNAERDLKSNEEWKRRKAQQTLANIDAAVAAKLHDWITQLLSNTSNSTRDFKVMRANRRGLLREEGYARRPSENVWEEITQGIRRRDGFKCMECGATNATLDVHHIIYLSHHGTNQKNNLITLCRKCHESEHGRVFDFGESQKDPEPASPIQPGHRSQTVPSLAHCQPDSGIDSELLVDGFSIAGAYIESGMHDFTLYAKAMVEDFGDGIKPYLLFFWEALRSYPGLNATGITDPAESARLHHGLLASQSQCKERHTMRGARYLSGSRIARELGEAFSKRLVNACIRDLQHMDGDRLLSGDSSGLRNVWDEICVQQQWEHSFSWWACQMTIEADLEWRLEGLQPYELEALWLLTREGDDWDCELEGERETYPVVRDHVQNYLKDEVLARALNWSNERISRYLGRRYGWD